MLKQRNALLKSGAGAPRRSRSTCARSRCGTRTWRPPARELLAGRLDLVDALRPLVDKAYQAVSEAGFASSGPATVDYRSSLGEDVPLVADRDLLAAALLRADGRSSARPSSSAASRWSARTATTCVLKLGPLPAKGYASHGESWSFALALRLASYDLLRAESDAAASRC